MQQDSLLTMEIGSLHLCIIRKNPLLKVFDNLFEEDNVHFYILAFFSELIHCMVSLGHIAFVLSATV